MKITKTKKNKYFSIALMLFITMSSILTIATNDSRILNGGIENELTPNIDVITPLISAEIGEEPWWNESYQWRYCLNVTNPGLYNLSSNYISVELDYSALVAAIRIRSDLTDLRIVENNVVRNYYVDKDFPSTGIATIWFQVDSTEGTSDYDTYMYFGNSSITYRGSKHQENCPGGLLWYDFEDAATTTVAKDKMQTADADFYGNGDLADYVSSTKAVGDYSVQFTGSLMQILRINDSLSYTGANVIPELTLSLFFRTSETGGGWTDNWAFFDYDRSEYFNFYVDPSNQRLGFSGAAANCEAPTADDIKDFDGNTQVSDDIWHHAAVTYDGNTVQLYVDGEPDGTYSNAFAGLALGDNEGLSRWGIIGDGSEAGQYYANHNSGNNDLYYTGYMDELRYYNHSIDSNDVAWLANYYEMDVELLDLVERGSAVTINVKDIDGRVVEGAYVCLWDENGILNISGVLANTTSDSSGTAIFAKVPFGSYNVTINYLLGAPSYKNETVYDTRLIPNGEISFTGVVVNIDAYCDLWTMDFEVKDVDGIPINYGYIVMNTTADGLLEKLTLDNNGEATFIWLNSSLGYNYTVYYENTDYGASFSPEAVFYGTVQRENNVAIYNVDQDFIKGTSYQIINTTYVKDSSPGVRGSYNIIDAKLNFTNMQVISEIDIYFIRAIGLPDDWYDHQEPTGDNISLFYNIGEDIAENIYGIIFDVDGINSTTCYGIIELTLTWAYTLTVTVPLAKLNISVFDETLTTPAEGLLVKISVNETADTIVELKVNEDGTAFGQGNNDLLFWYRTGVIYNMTLWIITENQPFRVNVSDQIDKPESTIYGPGGLYLWGYNYTLTSGTTILLKLGLNFQDRITEFVNASLSADYLAIWGDNMTYSLNYTYSTNAGGTWYPQGTGPDPAVAVVTITIKSTDIGNPVLLVRNMNFDGNGEYSITFNSSELSAGYSGKSYIVDFDGQKISYSNAPEESIIISINPKETRIELYNHTSKTELSTNALSQYEITATFGESFNISARYSDNITNALLPAESFSFTWIYGSGSVLVDPLNTDYYYFLFDTTLAAYTGTYNIFITASLENYSKKTDYLFIIAIVDTPTTLNGSSYPSNTYQTSIYIQEAHNLVFEYNETTFNTRLTSLTIRNYEWHKLDDNLQRLYGPGNEGSGNLIETADGLHVLDIDTETLSDGNYQIDVNIYKRNYGFKYVSVPLTISKRPIDSGQTSLYLSGVQGTSLGFTFTLTDSSNGSVLLTGVIMYLITSDGLNVPINPVAGSPGQYQLTFPTTSYNTFIMPQTLTGTIYMVKANHETTTIPVTIVVGMTEIFPGMPMFYFLMIVGSIAAVAISLVTYRTVQQRRIPNFVKKTKSAIKTIDSKGKISESLIYPPKDEYVVKLLGDRWTSLGLSLEDILGVQAKKKGKGAPSSDIKNKDIGGGGM